MPHVQQDISAEQWVKLHRGRQARALTVGLLTQRSSSMLDVLECSHRMSHGGLASDALWRTARYAFGHITRGSGRPATTAFVSRRSATFRSWAHMVREISPSPGSSSPRSHAHNRAESWKGHPYDALRPQGALTSLRSLPGGPGMARVTWVPRSIPPSPHLHRL